MSFVAKYKKEIIGGLIAIVAFEYFLHPIFHYSGPFFFRIAESVSSSAVDRLFAQAALGTGPNPALDWLQIFAGFIVAVTAFIAIDLVRGDAHQTPTNTSLTETADDTMPRVTPPPQVSTRWKVAFVVFVAILDVALFLMLWSVLFQFRIVTSFQQHMTAIAPFITDQQAKQFRSRWTQMRTKGDYDVIYRDLQKIADSNGIRLPPNYMYTPMHL
jgi:hypothetical protein